MTSIKVLKKYSVFIIPILLILILTVIYIVNTDRPFYLISNFHFNLVEESKDENSNPKVNKFLKSISESASKK